MAQQSQLQRRPGGRGVPRWEQETDQGHGDGDPPGFA